MYHSFKVFKNAFSVAFRQPKADSHCHFVHGYALSVRLDFEAELLDHRNWVVDFGELRSLREWIKENFDHKIVVAQDDPVLAWFMEGEKLGAVDLVVMSKVGCEAFARLIYNRAKTWLHEHSYAPRVSLTRVEVWEHDGNGAAYSP